ncbi:S8 family serine peptidase [Nonomuraea sp. NPDC023979]|uniref:S8 family serine peptidase n=1 Tax=Nonomuraea sp. NPDC023979 TaxID=3154796 RepID=UPI0034010CCF
MKAPAVTLLLVAATVVTPSPPARASAEPPAPAADEVTLITGDRVTVTGRGYRVTPADDREVSFSGQVRGGHLHVIPSDARPLIAKGVLDRRLFDVTQLLQWGYGDATRKDIPLIVQSASEAAGRLRDAGPARRLAAAGLTTTRLPKASAARTWRDLAGGGGPSLAAGTAKLWLDGRRAFTLDRSAEQIGAPTAWSQGFTGKGVKVAVLDSGYDPDHADLKNAVKQSRNFSDEPDIRDNIGHGTHVTSIIAGAGEKYRGVAPDAEIAVAKLGSRTFTESALLAAMEWAAVEVEAKVVNMSLGGPDTPGLDPVEQAVDVLSERTGALFVVAAGNSGRNPVSSPGSADAALTVGAVDRDGRLAPFSSAGPRLGDHAIKPDVTAPGVGIVAAQAGGAHVAMDGTSMAAPHVAGAAAILAQRHPGWTGPRLKAALMGSAAPAADETPYRQGAGLVDVARALAQPVVAEPGSLHALFPFGTAERVATRTITYTNTGDTPVTLGLTAEGELLGLSADRAEVPAHGQATVTLTIDASGRPTGDHPGVVTARSGDQVIRTPVGAYVEPETHLVTVTALGRSGTPVDPLVHAFDPETGVQHELSFADGRAGIRLPKGRWSLLSDTSEREGTTIAHTVVTVGETDQEVTLDARAGKQFLFSIDDPGAVQDNGFDFQLESGKWATAWLSFTRYPDRLFVVPAREPGLKFLIRNQWVNEATGSLYDLARRHVGGLPDDPGYAAERRELAKVTSTYRASGTAGTAGTATPLTTVRLGSASGMPLAPPKDLDLPGTLTQYRTPGLSWSGALLIGTALITGEERTARRGSTRELWNAAATGPSLAGIHARRTGDQLVFRPAALFADGAAGRAGSDEAATGTATVARDGQVLATADLAGCWIDSPESCEMRAKLPAGAATYTISASARRPAATLSTAVDAVWTVPSARTGEERPLPVMAMRFGPAGLDAVNRAPAGSLTRLPMRLEGGVRPVSVRLETSADDGATWRPVRASGAGPSWQAAVRNPGTPGYVSLRVRVEAAGGAALTQIVVRAYAVGPP